VSDADAPDADPPRADAPDSDPPRAVAPDTAAAAALEARKRAFLWIAIAYLAAGIVALLAGIALAGRHPIAIAAGADLAATLAVFAFSVAFRNSSFYDAYWSVAPLAIAFWFGLAPGSEAAPLARQLGVIALVALWAVRLTANWARGWTGLQHEDWRYVEIRAKTGPLYWLASLAGIHLFPTLIVFLGCLPLWPAIASGPRPLGILDAVAALVTLAGIALEYFADEELHRFRLSNPPREAICETGLWRHSRHPNYLGEMLFWWGLALFSLAAAGFVWWAWLGALAITAMFRFSSLPMMERRMLARRPTYAERQNRVPLVVPWPRHR
jgi:steroid 5-alpha reductase family enzyme